MPLWGLWIIPWITTICTGANLPQRFKDLVDVFMDAVKLCGCVCDFVLNAKQLFGDVNKFFFDLFGVRIGSHVRDGGIVNEAEEVISASLSPTPI